MRVYSQIPMRTPEGPTLPLADILNNYEHGKFVLSNLAAKRAKQLREGAPPLVRAESNHPLTIALAEIAAGKIKGILGALEAETEALDQDVNIALIEETVPAELGMLLPALDAELAESAREILAPEHLDHDEEPEADAAAPTLSDILGEGEEEVVMADQEEDTVSLTDLADEESSTEEEGEVAG